MSTDDSLLLSQHCDPSGDNQDDIPWILIVDDVDYNLKFLTTLLQKKIRSVRIVTARSGGEALQLAAQQAFALIILDVQLPDINGFDVATLLKQADTTRNTPIIFISAIYRGERHQKQGYYDGAVDYIEKPVDSEILIAKVKAFLSLVMQERLLTRQNQRLQAEISQREQIERQLRVSEQRYATVLDIVQEGIWDWQAGREELFVSDTLLGLLGYPRHERIVTDWSRVKHWLHPEDRPRLMREIRRHLLGISPQLHCEFRILHRDGQYRTFLCRGQRVTPQQAEQPWRMLGTCEDITEKKRAEADLLLSAAVFEQGAEAILITDCHGHIIKVNRAFTEITGYSAEEVLGKNPSLLKSGKHDKAFYQALWTALRLNKKWQGEIWNKKKNGAIFPQWETITAITDHKGEINYYIASFSDLTKDKEQEAYIYYLAHYDSLTDLPNRPQFEQKLKKALAYAQRYQKSLALLFLDIDRFKAINDAMGHSVGDKLLIGFARRLQSCLRAGDGIARFGTDEFVVLLGNDEPSEHVAQAAEQIALRIRESLLAPILVDDHEILVTVSIGIALFPNDADSVESLIRKADTALYKAKELGRDKVKFFDPEMENMALKRITLEYALRNALPCNQLRLYYQPKVDVTTGRIVGAETLLRWPHPDYSMVSPAEFIPIAEDSGLIIPIGQWVLKTCCQQIKAWEDAGFFESLTTIAVNISARQFNQDQFVESVFSVIEQTGIDPRHLEIELTESTLVTHVDNVRDKLHQLKARGIKIAIDDFGTGYSSLAYLKRFPLDVLKIDQSFVREITVNRNDEAIVKTIIAMAHNLNLDVVAEGVERVEQLRFLQDNGCRLYQGYLCSPAVESERYEQLLAGQCACV